MVPKYAPGDKIPGTPYVVSYTIGRGGGGAVLAVRDEHLDVLRAVKLLEVEPRLGERREDAVRALLREAVVVAKLHKSCREHIVEVLFVGQTADSHSVPYIVMELIDGAPLRDLLKRRGGKLEPIHARQVGIDVLAALAAAHDQGVVHRDLKPANIMCEVLDQNRVRMKVIDFGIAGGVNQRTKRVAGTFRYAAPEQIHIQGPSPLLAQTDLYSLGCILYECLAGQGPFDADCKTNEHYVTAHLTREPPPISKLVPRIPRAFDDFFASMLAKDPARRPASARACAAQLMDLPWNESAEGDATATEEMLEAAIQSVVRNHEEKRGAVDPQHAPTARPAQQTLASPGNPALRAGAPSTAPQDPPAFSGKGGTVRVPSLATASTVLDPAVATRTSAPHAAPAAGRGGTLPMSSLRAPTHGMIPTDENSFWGGPVPAPHDMDGKDPSTFGPVARTFGKISPSARWIAGLAVAASAAILFVALGVWLAHKHDALATAASAQASAPLDSTDAPIVATTAPAVTTTPSEGAAIESAAATIGSAAPAESASAPASASTSLTKPSSPTRAHTAGSSSHTPDFLPPAGTATATTTRKLPGSGL